MSIPINAVLPTPWRLATTILQCMNRVEGLLQMVPNIGQNAPIEIRAPPRMTQESYRLQVSDRTMVGTLATVTLVSFGTERHHRARKMKTTAGKRASPLWARKQHEAAADTTLPSLIEPDEIYNVIRGREVLIHDGKRDSFDPGEILFVAAGIEHQVEDVTQDLALWRLSYGPDGGDVPL